MRDEEVFKLVHTVYNIPIAILIGGGHHYVSIMHNNNVYACTISMCVTCVCICDL